MYPTSLIYKLYGKHGNEMRLGDWD